MVLPEPSCPPVESGVAATMRASHRVGARSKPTPPHRSGRYLPVNIARHETTVRKNYTNAGGTFWLSSLPAESATRAALGVPCSLGAWRRVHAGSWLRGPATRPAPAQGLVARSWALAFAYGHRPFGARRSMVSGRQAKGVAPGGFVQRSIMASRAFLHASSALSLGGGPTG